jgi:hypothetical protein
MQRRYAGRRGHHSQLFRHRVVFGPDELHRTLKRRVRGKHGPKTIDVDDAARAPPQHEQHAL